MTRPPVSKEISEHPRLSKRMGELGLCSRREADRWIESGWVKVDGQVVDTLGVRVSPDATIEIDRAAGHAIEDKNRRVLAPVERVFRRAGDIAQVASRDAAVTLEGDARHIGRGIHETLLSSAVDITRVNIACQ